MSDHKDTRATAATRALTKAIEEREFYGQQVERDADQLRLRIRNLRTALLSVRPAYLEYCDSADIIDEALAADSQFDAGAADCRESL